MRTKVLFAGAVIGVIGLAAAAAKALAEENYSGPSFEVVNKMAHDIELRKYSPRIVAEVEVDDSGDALNNAFRILAAYIFGENKSRSKLAMTSPVTTQQEKIPMTSPVTAESANGKLKMRFFMPNAYTLESLPEPMDKRISFSKLPEETFAAIRFSGAWRKSNFKNHANLLLDHLSRSNVTVTGEPVNAYYNPPFMPSFLRHNEVLIPVAR